MFFSYKDFQLNHFESIGKRVFVADMILFTILIFSGTFAIHKGHAMEPCFV